MLKQTSLVSAISLLIAGNLSFIPQVMAEEIICQGTLGAITVDNIKVPQGRTCTLNGTTVKGNIVVNSKATLRATAVKVNANIQAEGATLVVVSQNSTVGGSIQVKQGSRAQIVSTSINGDLQLESNSGALTANQNRIGGSLQAFQNTGGVTIRTNRINGNLQCKENSPAPVGGGNIVQGSKEDQCSSL